MKRMLIIVEGKSDTNKLKKFDPDIQTFETSGLGLDKSKIDYLKKVNDSYDFIVFTDPDGPGEIIRARLIKELKNLKHAYLPNDKALSGDKKSIGVEHATIQDIKDALDNVYIAGAKKGNYTIGDLVEMGVYANKEKRMRLCDHLRIAYGNNKKVVSQMNYFNIELKKIKEFLEGEK